MPRAPNAVVWALAVSVAHTLGTWRTLALLCRCGSGGPTRVWVPSDHELVDVGVFPCELPPLQQLLWTIRHFRLTQTWLAGHNLFSFSFWAISAVCVSTMLSAPRWCLRLCTTLLAAFGLGLRFTAMLQLLLQPKQDVTLAAPNCVPAGFQFPFLMLSLAPWLPVHPAALGVVCLLELPLMLVLEAVTLGPEASAVHLLLFATQNLTLGLLPLLVVCCSDQNLMMQPPATARCCSDAAGSGFLCTGHSQSPPAHNPPTTNPSALTNPTDLAKPLTAPTDSMSAATRAASNRPATPAHSSASLDASSTTHTVPARRPPDTSSTPSSPNDGAASAPHAPAATHARSAAPAPDPGLPEPTAATTTHTTVSRRSWLPSLAQLQQAMRQQLQAAPTDNEPVPQRIVSVQMPSSRSSPKPYISRLRPLTVSIKVNHHAAFDRRHQIAAAVQDCLGARLAGSITPFGINATSSPHHQGMPPADSTSHGISLQHLGAPSALATSRGPATASSHNMAGALVSMAALPGCLQLIALVHSHSSDAWCLDGALGEALCSQLQELVQGLLEVDASGGDVGLRPLPPDGVAIHAMPASTKASVNVSWAPLCAAEERMRLLPVVVEAGVGSAGQEVELRGAWEEGAGREEEAVVVFWRGGQCMVERQQVALAAGGLAVRLLLPPLLDTAPVEIHLLSACPTSAGTLLGSLTTMALPPGPAAEIRTAMLPPLQDELHDLPDSLMQMLADVAATWKLLHQEQCRPQVAAHQHLPLPSDQPPQQQPPPPPQQQQPAFIANCIDHILAFAETNNLTATCGFLLQLSSGRFLPDAAAPELLPVVLPDRYPDTTPQAAGVQLPPAGAASIPAAAVQGTLHVQQQPQQQQQAAPPRWPTAHSKAPHAAGHERAVVAPEQCGLQLASSSKQPPQSTRPTSDAIAPKAALPDYATWKMRHGRQIDVIGFTVMVLCWVAVFYKMWATGTPLRQIMLEQLPATWAFVAPLVLGWGSLSFGPQAVQRWRGAIFAGSAVCRAVASLAAALCVMPYPTAIQKDTLQASKVVIVFGVLVPMMERVDWKQQLLTSLLLDEVPKYLMLSAAPCWNNTPADFLPPTQGNPIVVAVTPLLGAAAAGLVEQLNRAVYRRLLAASRAKME